ncbi:uncharacterized protein LOC107693603 [Sinocyclocheilus anshuiensis]|uniref:uncharacterized protein LOC107693603 n=1 Tax=Sinocyclocheilus anshuiensis TaxID=1608454 RepID=UPI0007B8AA5A|nr:PREDICTED: uncharacterized protein LOC107693603 [Sinocyclocheilus anshuiensis]
MYSGLRNLDSQNIKLMQTFTMFRCLNLLLLLLLCLVYHSENTSKPVSGEKGGNVTLTCEFKAIKIVHIELFSQSEDIDVCQDEECSDRVFKEGNCDVVIKNLSFSDAGKYILRIYYNNQSELELQTREYQLHIHDEITVKTGEELELHVLLSNADKVQKSSSGEWREVWSRTDGVQSDQLNENDENLIFKVFLDRDAGTYRVLDTEGEILITVTVTESGTESKDKLENDKDKTNGTEQQTKWIVPVVVCLVILVVLIVISVIIRRRQHRGHTQVPAEENQEPPQELEEL